MASAARPEPIHPRPAPQTPKPKPGPKDLRAPETRTTTSQYTYVDHYGRRFARMPVRPRGAFVASARPIATRRGHLVASAWSLWREGEFAVLRATTRCGRQLRSAEVHIELPDFIELCDACALADFPAPACVYRMYSADGDLLYIGATTNLVNRLRSHFAGWPASPWTALVDRWTWECFDNELDAFRAEALAIAAEAPRFNTQHKVRAPRRPSAGRVAQMHPVLEVSE